MLNKLIQMFRFKGSFLWAVKQMKKGNEVTRKSFTDATVKYRCKPSGIIEITFAEKNMRRFTDRWETGALCHQYIQANDWCLYNDHPKAIK